MSVTSVTCRSIYMYTTAAVSLSQWHILSFEFLRLLFFGIILHPMTVIIINIYFNNKYSLSDSVYVHCDVLARHNHVCTDA